MSVRRYIVAALLAGVLVQPGCKPEEADGLKKEAAPRVKVRLPPSPKMVEPRRVERFVDGAWTVTGLLMKQADLLGTEVRVKGYVDQIVRCESASETDCDLPAHAVLVDEPGKTRRRLLVVGDSGTEFVDLQQGKAVTLAGTYLQSDPNGLFVRMDGILLLPPRPVEEKVEPP